MEIGKILKKLRKEKKETQEQTAKAIGIVVRHYQRIELNEGLPGIEVFIALADHFQVSMDYLAGRTDRREMLPPMEGGQETEV